MLHSNGMVKITDFGECARVCVSSSDETFRRAGLAKFSQQLKVDPWTKQKVYGYSGARFEGGTPLYFSPEQRWLTGELKGKSCDEVDKVKKDYELTPATADLFRRR